MPGKNAVLKRMSGYLPEGLRTRAKKLYFGQRHWAHPAMKRFGTVQDLYYWVRDGNLDTLLLLQNYFSAFYPNLQTDTHGVVTLYSKDGERLGEKGFSLQPFGCARFRVSSLLEEAGAPPNPDFGTLQVHLAIPKGVLAHIRDQRSIYFWDRFYIGYTTARGQACFVHGIDKTNIYREGKKDPVDWYKAPRALQWAPEMPVDIESYKKLSVIMVNRTSRKADVTLLLSDREDKTASWTARIRPKGVWRFELTPENTSSLARTELRMRIVGMPTQYGRPVVFKEFPNGAISAMHC